MNKRKSETTFLLEEMKISEVQKMEEKLIENLEEIECWEPAEKQESLKQNPILKEKSSNKEGHILHLKFNKSLLKENEKERILLLKA